MSDAQIAAALGMLRSGGAPVSWRALRASLWAQFGVRGRTDRLRAACRAIKAPQPELDLQDWQARAVEAEERAREADNERDTALARALRAEAREIVHQDRWAAEIHALRESVERLNGERQRRERLEERVVRLQSELQSLYARLARYEP